MPMKIDLRVKFLVHCREMALLSAFVFGLKSFYKQCGVHTWLCSVLTYGSFLVWCSEDYMWWQGSNPELPTCMANPCLLYINSRWIEFYEVKLPGYCHDFRFTLELTEMIYKLFLFLRTRQYLGHRAVFNLKSFLLSDATGKMLDAAADLLRAYIWRYMSIYKYLCMMGVTVQ